MQAEAESPEFIALHAQQCTCMVVSTHAEAHGRADMENRNMQTLSLVKHGLYLLHIAVWLKCCWIWIVINFMLD